MGWEGDGTYHEFGEKTYQRDHRRDGGQPKPLNQMATAIPFPAAVGLSLWAAGSSGDAAKFLRLWPVEANGGNPSLLNSPRFFHPMSVSR